MGSGGTIYIVFLTTILDESGWAVSRLGRFVSREAKGRMGRRADLDIMQKK